MKKKRRRRKKKRLGIIRSFLLLSILIAAIYGYSNLEEKSKGVISQGVYVANIDLSGKSPSEAEAVMKEKLGQPISSKKIIIEANDKNYLLEYSKLDVKYNINKVVEEAVSYGKEENTLGNIINRKTGRRKDFELQFTYNSKLVDELLEKIEIDSNKKSKDAKITIKGGKISIIPEVNGLKLQKDKLKGDIVAQINGDPTNQEVKVKAAFEVIKPKVTSEKLTVINSRTATYGTSFSTSTANRINNIELATKAINGTILMPGESFSFNETVGERTKARGYKEAGVIIGDKIESGLGGGICQVSSTLYNAILKANLKAVERRNHTLPLAYVPKGLDATVDWGHIDFKFKNTSNSPIYIEGYIKNKNVYFNIYSEKSKVKRSYEMATEVYATLQPSTKYVDDPNRNNGEVEVMKKGSIGYKVKVYRKTIESGKLLKTELISDDYYKVVDEEIIRGTKKNL